MARRRHRKERLWVETIHRGHEWTIAELARNGRVIVVCGAGRRSIVGVKHGRIPLPAIRTVLAELRRNGPCGGDGDALRCVADAVRSAGL